MDTQYYPRAHVSELGGKHNIIAVLDRVSAPKLSGTYTCPYPRGADRLRPVPMGREDKGSLLEPIDETESVLFILRNAWAR
jgi:hypothetical protein